MPRALLAFVGFVVAFTVASGEEFRATIIEVNNGKVTFMKSMKEAEKRKRNASLFVADNVKVVKGRLNKEKKIEAGEPVPDGLKNPIFEISKNNRLLRVLLVIDSEKKKITEIRVLNIPDDKKCSSD